MSRAVIYYSLTGNTEKTAKLIAEKTGADLIRIDTVKPMPKGFKSQIMYGGMLATFGMKPELKDVPEKLGQYDDIIMGTPVWAGTFAPAFKTLFARYPLADKVTAVFTYSGSGDNSKCIARLSKFMPRLKDSVSLFDESKGPREENKAPLEDFISKL